MGAAGDFLGRAWLPAVALAAAALVTGLLLTATPIGASAGARLGVTLPLALGASAVSLGLSYLILSFYLRFDLRRGNLLAGFMRLVALVTPMLLALGLIRLADGLMPVSGFVPWAQSPGGALGSLLLPALALGVPHGALLSLWARRAVEDLPAGAPRWWLVFPGFELAFPTLLAGTLVVESAFYLPGVGRLALSGALGGDLAGVAVALLVLAGCAGVAIALGRLLRLWLALRRPAAPGAA